MFTVQQTETFAQWLAELRDPRAKARVVTGCRWRSLAIWAM